jgi:L-glyceraldehyde 3-phosphate reductase
MAALLRTWNLPLLIHQPAYNLFNRQIESGLFEAVEKIGAGMIAFSPLAQGLLTDKYLKGVPSDSRAASGSRFLVPEHISQDVLRRTQALNDIARDRGQSLAQMAIAWVLRDPRMSSAIIGASSARQVRENVAALQRPTFSPEELAAIDRVTLTG